MIVFMGVAGSGKSVQGRLLADELSLPWLSTGEFLRMLISGQRRKDMLQGRLLDDQEIISLIRKVFTLINSEQEFVLDGFPRTMGQADWLLSQVKHGQLKFTAVIHLNASQAVVKGRLLERGRLDDTDAAITERFKEYTETTQPIIEFFQRSGVKVHEIDGERDIETVHKEIVATLKPHVH